MDNIAIFPAFADEVQPHLSTFVYFYNLLSLKTFVFMFGFFLLILLLVILWPLLKAGWQLWSNVRKVRQFMADPAEYYRRQGQKAQDSYGSGPKPRQKSKKISRDTGEYVAFEEISVSAEQRAADNAKNVTFREESQITDIDWEDVK